jgi:transposase
MVRQAPARTVVLFADETILREFPPLRATWAKRGHQAVVPITGNNARRSLFATLNPKTGKIFHRVLPNQRASSFQTFLHQLRAQYGRWWIWLILDRHASHQTRSSQELAGRLRIWPIWLPIACPEDNPVENLWRVMKAQVAANRSYGSIDELVRRASEWIDSLAPQDVLRISGVLSKHFWLST